MNTNGATLPKKRIFGCIPYSGKYRDVWRLGILEVANEIGIAALRAKDFERNGSITDCVHREICNSDAIIAEITEKNPNVLYEIGYARALGKPTILICRRGTRIPADLRSMNHIFYEDITGLRSSLKNRLLATL